MQRVILSRHKKIYILTGIAIILLAVLISATTGILWFWTASRYYIRAYFSDIVALVLVLAGVLYAMMPKKAAEAERKGWHVIIGALLIVLGLAGFIYGLIDKKENARNMRDLLDRSKIQATTQDINNLRQNIVNDLKQSITNDLRQDLNNLTNEIKAIANFLQTPSKTVKIKPSLEAPPVTTTPPTSTTAQNKISLGPEIVQHIQVSQGRTVSNRDDAPYALQVILQTDVSTQPTAFMIETDGDIEDGRFFLVGQAVMMSVGYGVQPDKRHFYLGFAFPAFTPPSPIVITLLSKTDIRVIAVRKAN
ncbi:MAG: hypothetical protein ABSH06_14070 [Thermodesulfobacteriota bacterium]